MDLYGPALPPGYVKPDNESEDSEDDLPSKKESKESQKIIGPQCPDFILRKSCEETNENNSEKLADSEIGTNSIGPMLPSSFHRSSYDSEEEMDESYGPLPNQSSGESDWYDRKVAIEKRAENMRNKLDNKYIPSTEALQREEWMVVPDTSRKNQLSAISQCLAPQKTSAKEKHHHHRHSEKDKKTSEELKKYNKSKRSESLLDMHKKSLKKKSKDKIKTQERKAFDRDEIAVKQFSKQQVNTIVDKAKYLNSRFGAGSQQYL